jgi:hypothetical protein
MTAPASAPVPREPLAAVDFDLHGLVGVRLVGGGPVEVRALRRQLGPIEAPLAREPDIVVRIVDRLPVSGRVRYLGVDDAGFTDDAFLVLRARHKARARVQLPLHRIGERIEILCERGLPSVPLLVPILNLTALALGVLPLHASAFLYGGVGVVCTGWSKGGKTEALLAFAEHGARYVGDEWVYVSEGGRRISGIPEPVRVWDWYVRELGLRSALSPAERARLRGLRAALALGRISSSGAGARLPWARAYRRAEPLLRRQQFVDVPPERLFLDARGASPAPFDRLFFVVSEERDDVAVSPADPDAVARRMAFSLAHERLEFLGFYAKFRFAFPELSSQVVETAAERERELLAAAFEGKPAYTVAHPYPVSLRRLFAAMEPYCA